VRPSEVWSVLTSHSNPFSTTQLWKTPRVQYTQATARRYGNRTHSILMTARDCLHYTSQVNARSTPTSHYSGLHPMATFTSRRRSATVPPPGYILDTITVEKSIANGGLEMVDDCHGCKGGRLLRIVFIRDGIEYANRCGSRVSIIKRDNHKRVDRAITVACICRLWK